jgi:hypothetical protein
MKKLLIVLILLVLGAATYWYGARAGWYDRTGPTNLPTAEERERMEKVERSSAQIAPDAKPGIQVRPKGSTPPPPTPEETATSSEESPAEAM